MSIGLKIKEARKSSNLTQMELAQKTSLSRSYIGDIEKDRYNPSVATLKLIAAATQQPMSFFVDSVNHESDPPKHGVRIPVLGTVVAGSPSYAVENIIGWEEVTPKMAQQGKLFALKIRGESMMPDLHPEDLIVVQETPDVESGETAVVLINRDEATVKQIKKTPEGVVLYAKNPSVYAPHFYTNKEIEELPVKIIGKVIESRRMW
ncbi:LexA family protein [Acidaminococcus massiliensis]|uniref:LexA family protein n=1 Tax=Acidaminococcus massiliensis TaxID=1852375 RepID=UPI003520EA49